MAILCRVFPGYNPMKLRQILEDADSDVVKAIQEVSNNLFYKV